MAASRAWSITWPTTTSTRWTIRARHRRQPEHGEARATSTWPSRARRSIDAEDLYGIVPHRRARALRRARGDRAHRRWLRVRRIQGAVRHDAGLRVCAHLGLSGGDPGQQRRAVFRERAEGRPFHRAGLQARHPAGVPAEHLGLHGRRQIRGRRHRQGRRQAGDCRGLRRGAQVHRPDRRLVSAPAITACAGGPIPRASCSPGPTAASR